MIYVAPSSNQGKDVLRKLFIETCEATESVRENVKKKNLQFFSKKCAMEDSRETPPRSRLARALPDKASPKKQSPRLV